MRQFLIAFDQLVNTVAGGWADETLSARAWRRSSMHLGWDTLRVAIDLLFFWQEEHCRAAFWAEYNRKQLPKAYRNDHE